MKIKFWLCLACLLICISIASMVTIFTIMLKLPNNDDNKQQPIINRFRKPNDERANNNNNNQQEHINTIKPTSSPILNADWFINGFEETVESHYTDLKTAMVLVCYNRPK